jgi:hypothetical protein
LPLFRRHIFIAITPYFFAGLQFSTPCRHEHIDFYATSADIAMLSAITPATFHAFIFSFDIRHYAAIARISPAPLITRTARQLTPFSPDAACCRAAASSL